MKYVSFLDVMCCGFAGTLLLFLIIASTEKDDAERVTPYLVIRCRETIDETSKFVGGELGIEYRRKGTATWIRVNSKNAPNAIGTATKIFHPRTIKSQHADSVFVCRQPREGVWEFRAYMADFPEIDGELADSVEITVDVFGAESAVSNKSTLEHPGMSTSIATVKLN